MYTLKFCSFYEDGMEYTYSVSCTSYGVSTRHDGTAVVTAYPAITQDGGVDFNLVSREVEDVLDTPLHFHGCYVENMNGKTINTIVPKFKHCSGSITSFSDKPQN